MSSTLDRARPSKKSDEDEEYYYNIYGTYVHEDRTDQGHTNSFENTSNSNTLFPGPPPPPLSLNKMRRPIIIFMLTMPLSRSMRPRPGGCSQLPARSRCPLRATPPIFHLLSRPPQLTGPRLFSASEKTARGSTTNGDDNLLDPYVILRDLTNQDAPTISFPTHYSPTSLETLCKCPQAFFFLYILRLTPDPPMTP